MKPIRSRLEELERERGISARIEVTVPCPRCGKPLLLDDRGSACGTHPRILPADKLLNIRFVSPESRRAKVPA